MQSPREDRKGELREGVGVGRQGCWQPEVGWEGGWAGVSPEREVDVVNTRAGGAEPPSDLIALVPWL